MSSDDRAAMSAGGFSRRAALKVAGIASALATLELVGRGTKVPIRLADSTAAAANLPDIQFDISNFIAPAQTEENGVVVRFGPQQTTFLTAQLTRTPTKADQQSLNSAMTALEANYPFSAGGIFCFLAYGIPYFNRLPGGLTGTLVSGHMPKLASNHSRAVLEEAVPSPTDVSPSNPTITKLRYNIPVAIEHNDMLITIRGDDPTFVADVVSWFGGSNSLAGRSVASPAPGLFRFTSSRAMFQAMGLPKFVAGANNLPYAQFIHPNSPMWMGFADQQVDGSGPAAITTFAGNASAHVTTAAPGDYFDNGSIQHLSHDILDLLQWFDMDDTSSSPGSDGTFLEHVQYMFRADPPPSKGNSDQFTNGGGPSFLDNAFQGTGDAAKSAQGIGTLPDPTTGQPQRRMGHLSTLQRSSRAADGTPMHIRMDGAGFDNLDVPDGSNQPKLQFTVFVPSSDFFAKMRTNQASLDLQNQFGVDQSDNGLERFITATRRQNFLCPPRRHRAFPLLELT
jgi:hypothetical protein